ncbi:beta-L-arabinofuranosidase domain-containing protein [Zunongwangia pacifica]|uniref:Glycoside hydrolase family 127 protein n=1 Tax=Zunongwangia pacifica TaxID=2911062 RepID=A0A9X2A1H8_9FLAO|nr:beta-L-arabinofuranosidase domain-containing protein [Zunongwangia pacifica]MCL6220316.1 glycoside hydrolase family 127 protein [Zunongwangia pacifica]
MKLYKIIACFICVLIAGLVEVRAQGDQILDGIGETGLIARYVFDKDAKDWSRNNLHAAIKGDAEFVKDELFKNVLSLSKGSYITLPASALSNVESVSIAGWVKPNSTNSGQIFFYFGKNQNSHTYLAPFGTGAYTDFTAEVAKSMNKTYTLSTSVAEVSKDRWSHLVLVIDVPSKAIKTYINGVQVGMKEKIDLELSDIFNVESGEENQLYIGKAIAQEQAFLDASIHDFRMYRIALTDNQVNGIFENALKKQDGVVNERKEPQDNLPEFSRTAPQVYNEFLTSVEDIEIETEVGVLPRLPRTLAGTYKNGLKGPKVKVIWPAPTDNSEVLKTGTYTIIGSVAGTDLAPKATVNVVEHIITEKPDRKLETFSLDQVSLEANANGQNTKFIENRDKFINTLAETDPDSFLYMFRNAFGQQQPQGAKPLGVWDTQETKLRGHATGHYLTAIAQAYASTGYDKELQQNFADKMEYMVNTLYQLSQMSGKPAKDGGDFNADPTAVPMGPGKEIYSSDLSEEGIRTDYWNWGEGFISAYPPDQFIMLENGAVYGTEETKIWAPYYTLHKILAGLMDIYEVSGNKKALAVAEGMGDWVYARLSELPTETLISMWNRYIAGEFGGMNEAMARLYRITGKEEYLKTAKLFDNIKVFFGDANHSHGLAKNVDTFRGLHANQHIPQIVGALEMYRDSDKPEYFNVADNFWVKATNDYMYSIGGVAGARNPANAECFIAQPGTLYENGLSAGGQNETCATYNMLKLTRDLFLYEQRPELMDYYERGLYNHILASVAEDSPANTYHVPLRPGSKKSFGNPNMTGFTCCNGTALESSTKLQNSIYFKDANNKALYVNLYVPSTLHWHEQNIKLTQETNFPKEDHTKLTINGKGKFDLKLRVPGWATRGFILKINGKEEKMEATPGTYVTLSRKWKDGDTVELKMPFSFYLDPVMDQQNIASLFYGPVLLAAQEDEPRTEWRKVKFDAENIGASIKGNPEELTFEIDGIIYKPFYETYGRHSVYLDVDLE